MIASQVKRIFDSYFEAPIAAWETFAEYLNLVYFKKGEEIKASHTTEKRLYIISKGSAGIFLWKENHSVCIDLCYENEFFGDYMSLITQSPSPLYTISLEETEMFCLSGRDLFHLYEKTQIGARIARIASESLFIHKQSQQIELLTMTAEERYKQLLERQPNIIQRTPLKHIASYLGVNPESLSRIRKKIVS